MATEVAARRQLIKMSWKKPEHCLQTSPLKTLTLALLLVSGHKPVTVKKVLRQLAGSVQTDCKQAKQRSHYEEGKILEKEISQTLEC